MDIEQLEQLGLALITAYVPTDSSPAKRGKSAERMQRLRAREKAEGIMTVKLKAEQAASLESDLALAQKVKSLKGLRKLAVMRLLA